MTDHEAVEAIERQQELVLLGRLLEERTRRIPPPPASPAQPTDLGDERLRRRLAAVMRLVAEAIQRHDEQPEPVASVRSVRVAAPSSEVTV